MAKEIDYENLKPKDIEEKEIKVKIAKGAFKGPIHCQRCNIRMKKTYTDMDHSGWRDNTAYRGI